jgi:hypothetical protein
MIVVQWACRSIADEACLGRAHRKLVGRVVFVALPAEGILEDIFAVSIEIVIVANDVIKIVALPNRFTGRMP